MLREERIQRYAKLFFWEEILKQHLSKMKLEFQKIVFIEEILPFANYIGYVKVKSDSNNEFIEVRVSFNSRGSACIKIDPRILNDIQDEISGGKVIFIDN
jgi:hypothetical protein